MADTTTVDPGTSCLENLKGYVKTTKGVILATEIVSAQTWEGQKCLCI